MIIEKPTEIWIVRDQWVDIENNVISILPQSARLTTRITESGKIRITEGGKEIQTFKR